MSAIDNELGKGLLYPSLVRGTRRDGLLTYPWQYRSRIQYVHSMQWLGL